ncbi:hypothetical protein [Candidatus Nitrososphaera sp. FF02]|uniref:hypothetical protein n=1 Tax=Candidatus Nitrososphaera sp. FF02 TaxID=3398226 RepID=UPI0039EA9810
MAMLMDVSAAVSLINIGMLAVLMAMYGRIYGKTRAVFTLGLMFFSAMLALHNAIAVYAYFAMAPLYADALLPYFVGVHIAELAGIAALLKVTIRPS